MRHRDGIDQVQRAGLCGDLARRRHDGQRADLLGVGRLVLEQLALELVYFNLSVRVEHATRDRESERHGDDY